MAATIPQPLEDQTIESLAAVAWARNPWPRWTDVSKALFGSPVIKAGALIHSGVEACFQTLGGLGYESKEELLSKHCYLPLFKPFLEPALYDNFQQFMIDGKTSKLICLSKVQSVASGLRYCCNCIESDRDRHGYAYLRRSHQVSGVQVCHIHGRLLHRLDWEKSDEFARHGLLILKSDGLTQASKFSDIALSGSHSSAMRYAGFAAASLMGTHPISAVAVRQAAYLERLQTRSGGKKSPAAILTHELRINAGDALLAELGLDPVAGPSAGWPAMILNGPAYGQHPLANLLVISTLFSDVDDFQQVIARNMDRDPQSQAKRRSATCGLPRVGLSLALIKDTLREPSLACIAKKNGIFFETIEALFRSFPKLAERRPHALWRRRRRHARSEVRCILDRKPSANRNDLTKEAKNNYMWLLRHDRAWLDRVIPTRQPKQSRMGLYDAALDSKIATETSSLLGRLEADHRAHLRRSQSLLIGLLNPAIQIEIRSGRLPIARASLKSLEESKVEHRDRCLGRIQHFLICGDEEHARSWARELLLLFPGDHNLIDRVLLALLSVKADTRESVEI